MAQILFGEIGPELQQRFPEVTLNKDEQLAEQDEFFATAAKLFILALGMIYILMAAVLIWKPSGLFGNNSK